MRASVAFGEIHGTAGRFDWVRAGRLCLVLWLVIPGILLVAGTWVRLATAAHRQSLSPILTMTMGLLLMCAAALARRDSCGLALAWLGCDLGLWLWEVLRSELLTADPLEVLMGTLSHGVFPLAAAWWAVRSSSAGRPGDVGREAAGRLLVIVFLANLPGTGIAVGEALAAMGPVATGRPEAAAGRRLPVLRFAGIDGEETVLDDPETVYVLSFWATWCQPCLRELPEIQALKERLGSLDRLQIVVVNTEDLQRAELERFLREHRLSGLPVHTDPARFRTLLGVSSLPETLLVRRREVLARYSGYHEGIGEEIERKLKELLSSQAQETGPASPVWPVP